MSKIYDDLELTGSIELGHASDTTIARSGAGAITVEGVQVILSGAALGTPSGGTLTNCSFPTLNQNTTGSSGSCTGLSATATALATARTIGGTSFNGTANIVPSTITIADESADTSCYPLFATAVSGGLQPKTGTNLTFNSSTGALTVGSLVTAGTVDGVDVSTHAALNIHDAVADESTDTSCYIAFVTAATGNLAIKTGTNIVFNSSSGLLNLTAIDANKVVINTSINPDGDGGATMGTGALHFTTGYFRNIYLDANAAYRINFWDSSSYSMYMSPDYATEHFTSDYNMYFTMTGGTNRGFVFLTGTTPNAQIDASGNFWVNGDIHQDDEEFHYWGNAHDCKIHWNNGGSQMEIQVT